DPTPGTRCHAPRRRRAPGPALRGLGQAGQGRGMAEETRRASAGSGLPGRPLRAVKPLAGLPRPWARPDGDSSESFLKAGLTVVGWVQPANGKPAIRVIGGFHPPYKIRFRPSRSRLSGSGTPRHPPDVSLQARSGQERLIAAGRSPADPTGRADADFARP